MLGRVTLGCGDLIYIEYTRFICGTLDRECIRLNSNVMQETSQFGCSRKRLAFRSRVLLFLVWLVCVATTFGNLPDLSDQKVPFEVYVKGIVALTFYALALIPLTISLFCNWSIANRLEKLLCLLLCVFFLLPGVVVVFVVVFFLTIKK
jgi:hypothetical protein